MMLALILAQLVLPWPGLDSPLVQPGPTICVGACAGPVIYGPGESRGRLVVACDMTSDTCSDGRKITTTRATPVPCETSPGVWEMVPEDTGCYGVRGLEAWRENTSYLAYGAQLDHALWTGQATATKVGSIYRVCGETFGAYRQRLAQEEGGVVRTSACHVRAGTSNSIRFLSADITSGGVNYDYTLTSEWQTVTATATVREEGGVAGVRLHPATAGAGCIDVAGCWSVRGNILGRACWGGAAPVHCDAERHTISTEGWPTEAGEITIRFYLRRTPGVFQTIINTRVGSSGNNELVFEVSNAERLVIRGWGGQQNSAVLDWPEKEYIASIAWGPWGRRVKLDGVTVIESTEATVMRFGPTAVLGGSNISFTQQINGSIRSLTVRSFE